MVTAIVHPAAMAPTIVPSSPPAAPSPVWPPGPRSAPVTRPSIIGHRGAAGYRPEHTLASYELAARMGADFIEPDLVSTRDGVLVARHEPEIGGTTDVARHPGFASRRTVKMVDGQARDGWFVEDFTLAELRTLRAVERIPDVRQRNTLYDRRFGVPTFAEVVALAARLTAELGRPVGVYPETKHPSYFAGLGLALEPPLVAALRAAGLDRPDSPVFVQSFEVGNLRALRQVLDVPLVQLTEASGAPWDLVAAGDPRTYADLVTPAGLAEVSRYAAAIGPDKHQLIGPDGVAGPVLADAHDAGLVVHPYTFRNENRFLPADRRSDTPEAPDPHAFGDALGELARYLALGVDAVFCDHPDTAVQAREEHLAGAGAQTMVSSR
jgi:glycerophosphoryl diester phosphodiesterase